MSNGQYTPESAAATPARAPLDAARLTARLRMLGYADVDVVRVTGSTNSDLCNRTEAPNGTVLALGGFDEEVIVVNIDPEEASRRQAAVPIL